MHFHIPDWLHQECNFIEIITMPITHHRHKAILIQHTLTTKAHLRETKRELYLEMLREKMGRVDHASKMDWQETLPQCSEENGD